MISLTCLIVDGTKVAKATSIDNLLAEDFDLVINARRFAVKTPETGEFRELSCQIFRSLTPRPRKQNDDV